MNKHEWEAFELLQEAFGLVFDENERLEERLVAIRSVAVKGSISNAERVTIVEICDGRQGG